MADAVKTATEPDRPTTTADSGYTVVARRYRPQLFEELVGQEQVAKALTNAIATNRVGHAYLFCGARGVGKTSAARILAKALNCAEGPTATPCGTCDSCLATSSGDDVDVLEIDGASNRGIDEIRQLRSNVSIRPSRSRFKVYIIDEVHMLTTPAFNALLKTLEEPPEHVKFIFCTTDPEKVPITVLSRCQRFDFSGIHPEKIAERLRHIAAAEGAEIDDVAVRLLARRASGSMRDSQSLLEQLLSYGGTAITVESVHAMLGTARGGQLDQLIEALVARDAQSAIAAVAEAVTQGVDPGQLLEQLLAYYRDLLVLSVGCDENVLIQVDSAEVAVARETAERYGRAPLLAAVQILDATAAKMRQSVDPRTLVEIALVRLCSLSDLDDLAALLRQPSLGGGGATPAKGTPPPRPAAATTSPAPRRSSSTNPNRASLQSLETASRSTADSLVPPAVTESTTPANAVADRVEASSEAASSEAVDSIEVSAEKVAQPLTTESAKQIWRQALAELGDMTADMASRAARVTISDSNGGATTAQVPADRTTAISGAISGPNRLAVFFPAKYTSCKSFCDVPNRRKQLEEAVRKVSGQAVSIEFHVETSGTTAPKAVPAVSGRQKVLAARSNELVRHAIELFDADVLRVDDAKKRTSSAGTT